METLLRRGSAKYRVAKEPAAGVHVAQPDRNRLRLHILQAQFGDCLLVDCPDREQVRHILVDGGPGGTYGASLRVILTRLAARGGSVDLAVLSHIDNDHILGLLDYMQELRDSRAGQRGALPRVGSLWHNSFSVAAGGADVAPLARQILAQIESAAPRRGLAAVVSGVAEGDALAALAQDLRVPRNANFGEGQVLADGADPIRLGDVTIHVAGPSRPILDQLREEWLEWQRKHGDLAGARRAAVAADRSVPNLSSITMLVQWKGRRLLLTGDGRGEQVTEGLAVAGLLDGGVIHVSMLKMPHHGSARNVSPAFLRTVTADRYVFSANGRYGNPDLQCLIWTVEAAREAGRRVELLFTNHTAALDQLKSSHPAAEFGYRTRVLSPGRRAMSVTV
jgi:beta-lactamase superfamily II metal-dependent hydrolase